MKAVIFCALGSEGWFHMPEESRLHNRHRKNLNHMQEYAYILKRRSEAKIGYASLKQKYRDVYTHC
jgi:hypothetical protein